MLCIEWTLPRCSKNTGQLVAHWARLVTAERIRRGNIVKSFLIYLKGNRVQGIFSLVTKMFISLVPIGAAVYCGPYLMSHVT